MASNSIAAELLEKMTEIEGNTTALEYKEMVAPLSVDNKLPDHVFQHLKRTMKGKYIFNSELFSNKQGTAKPNGIFELFGRYTNESTNDIRERMIDYVHVNTADLKNMTMEYFKTKLGNLMMWTYCMSKPTTPGDELVLFILCKTYYQHAVVHTIQDPWCTINTSKTGPIPALEDKCDIVLVFSTFGFSEAQCIKPSQTETVKPSQRVATVSSTKTAEALKTTNKRCTVSITDLLE